MPSDKIQITFSAELRNAIPFRLGQTKPKHFRDMLKIVWRNRDNLPYDWRVD